MTLSDKFSAFLIGVTFTLFIVGFVASSYYVWFYEPNKSIERINMDSKNSYTFKVPEGVTELRVEMGHGGGGGGNYGDPRNILTIDELKHIGITKEEEQDRTIDAAPKHSLEKN